MLNCRIAWIYQFEHKVKKGMDINHGINSCLYIKKKEKKTRREKSVKRNEVSCLGPLHLENYHEAVL
jgi:hypothetical protein